MSKNTNILTKDEYLKLLLNLFKSFSSEDINFHEFMNSLKIICTQYRKDYKNVKSS